MRFQEKVVVACALLSISGLGVLGWVQAAEDKAKEKRPVLSEGARAKWWRAIAELNSALAKRQAAEDAMRLECATAGLIVDPAGEPQCTPAPPPPAAAKPKATPSPAKDSTPPVEEPKP